MKRNQMLAVLNVTSFLLQIGVAYVCNQQWITNKDVGAISENYFSLFTPADFTFGIWGIIYTYLAIFCIYHIVMAYKRNKKVSANKDLENIGYKFMILNVAAASWLIVWVNNLIGISLVLIFIQLILLLIIHIRLHIHSPRRGPSAKLATELPLSIYLGWISLATIANTSIYLVSIRWNGWGISADNWTVIMVTLSILLGLFMLFMRRNLAYALVIIWGLYGIISRLSALETSYNRIIYTAWAGIGILSLGLVIQAVYSSMHYKQSIMERSKTESI